MKTMKYIAIALATILGSVSVYAMGQDQEYKEAADAKPFTPENVAQANSNLLDAIIDHNVSGATQALIDGAQVNQADTRGITPLSHACSRGNTELAQLLLNHGAIKTINQADHYNFTPLLDACIAGKPALLKILAFHGAIISLPSEKLKMNRSMPESIRTFMKQAKEILHNRRAIIEQAQEARRQVGDYCLQLDDVVKLSFCTPIPLPVNLVADVYQFSNPLFGVQDPDLRQLIKKQILKNRKERCAQESAAAMQKKIKKKK